MQRRPPAKYRLNRRAALVLSGLFLFVGCTAGLVCFWRLRPERRAQYLRESANEYLREGQWQQAALQLGNLTGITPNDAPAWYELGTLHLRILRETNRGSGTGVDHMGRDRLGMAIACFRRAAEIDPDHAAAQRWLLELDLRGGNWSDARIRRKAVERLTPADPLVPLAWDLIPSMHGDVVDPCRRLLEKSGTEKEVVERLAPLNREVPADLDVLGPLAIAYTRLGEKGLRGSCFARARKVIGNSPRLLFVQAEVAIAEGAWDQGEDLARQAARAPHVERAARHLLAELELRRASVRPTESHVHRVRAVAEYRRILDKYPDDSRAVVQAAWVLGKDLGRTRDALTLVEESLGRFPEPTAPLFEVHGWLLSEVGQAAAARPILERASRLAPGDTSILLHLAVACQRTGDVGQAGEILGELAARSVALSEIQFLLAQTKRLDPLRTQP